VKLKTLIVVLFGLFVQYPNVNANETKPKDFAPSVFIDCENCDFDYIRSEIGFVNYVIDRKNADIYILITSERRGGGGEKYTLNFSGRKLFASIKAIHTFTTHENDTENNIRVKMAKALKLGLVPYVANTPIGNNINISYSSPKKSLVKSDPWNNWVFRTQVGGDMRGEKFANRKALNTQLSAERITEQWKIRMGSYMNYQEEEYKIGEKSVVGISRIRQFQSMLVKSLAKHWSFGLGLEAGSSTYSNMKGYFLTYPAIEYNVFPYSESTRREFRIYYGAGLGFNRYDKETIYEKTEEWLWGQRIGVEAEAKQEWGRIDIGLEGMNYFQDMSKNHLRITSDISLHLVKGLSFAIHGGVSMIHDQLALPKGEASSKEILLQIREMETQYNYWFALGFEYTFGSIYNNIVNSRFGNGS
jgi:hypothetical protein